MNLPWVYCKCGQNLWKPTIEEIVAQKKVCPYCGHENNPEITVAELLVQMNERIEKLEDMI